MSGQLGTPDFFAGNIRRETALRIGRNKRRDADLSRDSRGRVSNEASSAGRRTADVPDGSGAAIRRMLLADESHTKGGIKQMAKKAAKGGKKKGGKKR